MEPILLKTLRSELQYQGQFEKLSFGPLANPGPLYQSLLTHLGKHGATLQSLTYAAPPFADANVSCLLTELSVTTQIRLDRLEINFLRFHEVGRERAVQILLDSLAALHAVDASTVITGHVIGITIYTQIQNASYDQVIGRYVTVPQGLAKDVRAGIAFYLPIVQGGRQLLNAIVLDRIVASEQGILVRATLSFDAKHVPVDTLAQEVDSYFTRYLDQLGLVLDQENQS
jgi:hypothetical protein